MALWLIFNCGGGLCLVQYLSWRLSTKMTTACDKKPLVKNSSDLWKQINNFWHSSSFSPYQQRCHHYISLCPQKVFFATFSSSAFFHSFCPRSDHFPQIFGHRGKLHYFLIIWPPNVPTTYRYWHGRVTIPVIIITVMPSVLTRLMICSWHCRLYCSPFKQNGVPNNWEWLKFWHRHHFVAYILPLQAINAYILPTCRQCLYSGVIPKSSNCYPVLRIQSVATDSSWSISITCHVTFE